MIWLGCREDKRGHLVSWDLVCLAKEFDMVGIWENCSSESNIIRELTLNVF